MAHAPAEEAPPLTSTSSDRRDAIPHPDRHYRAWNFGRAAIAVHGREALAALSSWGLLCTLEVASFSSGYHELETDAWHVLALCSALLTFVIAAVLFVLGQLLQHRTFSAATHGTLLSGSACIFMFRVVPAPTASHPSLLALACTSWSLLSFAALHFITANAIRDGVLGSAHSASAAVNSERVSRRNSGREAARRISGREFGLLRASVHSLAVNCSSPCDSGPSSRTASFTPCTPADSPTITDAVMPFDDGQQRQRHSTQEYPFFLTDKWKSAEANSHKLVGSPDHCAWADESPRLLGRELLFTGSASGSRGSKASSPGNSSCSSANALVQVMDTPPSPPPLISPHVIPEAPLQVIDLSDRSDQQGNGPTEVPRSSTMTARERESFAQALFAQGTESEPDEPQQSNVVGQHDVNQISLPIPHMMEFPQGSTRLEQESNNSMTQANDQEENGSAIPTPQLPTDDVQNEHPQSNELMMPTTGGATSSAHQTQLPQVSAGALAIDAEIHEPPEPPRASESRPIEETQLKEALIANISCRRTRVGDPVSGARLEEIFEILGGPDSALASSWKNSKDSLTDILADSSDDEPEQQAMLSNLNMDGLSLQNFNQMREGNQMSGVGLSAALTAARRLSSQMHSQMHSRRSSVLSSRVSMINSPAVGSRKASRQNSVVASRRTSEYVGSALEVPDRPASRKASVAGLTPGSRRQSLAPAMGSKSLLPRNPVTVSTCPSSPSGMATGLVRSSGGLLVNSDVFSQGDEKINGGCGDSSGVSDGGEALLANVAEAALGLPLRPDVPQPERDLESEVAVLRSAIAEAPSGTKLRDVILESTVLGDLSVESLLSATSAQDVNSEALPSRHGRRMTVIADEGEDEEVEGSESACSDDEPNTSGYTEKTIRTQKHNGSDVESYSSGSNSVESTDNEDEEDSLSIPGLNANVLDSLSLDPALVSKVMKMLLLLNTDLSERKGCSCPPQGPHTCMSPVASILASQIQSLQQSLAHSVSQSIVGTRLQSRRTSSEAGLKSQGGVMRLSLPGSGDNPTARQSDTSASSSSDKVIEEDPATRGASNVATSASQSSVNNRPSLLKKKSSKRSVSIVPPVLEEEDQRPKAQRSPSAGDESAGL